MTAERTIRLVVVSAVFGAAALAVGAPSAAHGAWCARYHTCSANCHFSSREQCLASVSGVGGACTEIHLGAPPPETAEQPERARRTQQQSERIKRQEAKRKENKRQ